MLNKRIFLTSFPMSLPSIENFACLEEKVPELSKGQVLCKTHYLSLDPYMHSQMMGRYITDKQALGETLSGETVSEIIQSKCKQFPVGQLVRCMGGWQQYSLHKACDISEVITHAYPSFALSLLGMPGLTAYAGLTILAKAKKGDVVVIPAATGAVGATAGQLAKMEGCIVVGIVGNEQKRKYALDELGYDFCIDRNVEDVGLALKSYCPNGIDIYFDLVAGDVLQQASELLAKGARVILCGQTSQNQNENSVGPAPGLWIKSRATIHGLVVYDYEDKRKEYIEHSLQLVNKKKLKMREDICINIESAPAAFCKLINGDNFGKTIVKLCSN